MPTALYNRTLYKLTHRNWPRQLRSTGNFYPLSRLTTLPFRSIPPHHGFREHLQTLHSTSNCSVQQQERSVLCSNSNSKAASMTKITQPLASDAVLATGPVTPRCSEEDMLNMINSYDCWVFDLDGTIWRGSELIEGAVEVLQLLQRLGKKVLYMTNNSMKSRSSYLGKFTQLGVPAHEDDIYCSSYSAAAYLDSIGFDRSKKAYVVGEQGIIDELTAVGIKAFGGPHDNDKRCSFSQEMTHDTQVGAVVCGVDPGLSYYKIQYASMCLLQNPGCLFIATNADARGHFTPNQEWAGAGASVGAIKAVVEREPIVTGKPSPFLMSDIAAKHGVTPSRSIMVGDRLDTDIAWGLNTGMATLLVMTGVTDEKLLAAHQQGLVSSSTGVAVKPHHVLDSLGDLRAVVPLLKQP